MIGPVVMCNRELVRIAGKSNDRRTTSKELGVLNGVSAQPTNTEDSDYAIWTESARIADGLRKAASRSETVPR